MGYHVLTIAEIPQTHNQVDQARLLCQDRGHDLQPFMADPNWIRGVPPDDPAVFPEALREALQEATAERGLAGSTDGLDPRGAFLGRLWAPLQPGYPGAYVSGLRKDCPEGGPPPSATRPGRAARVRLYEKCGTNRVTFAGRRDRLKRARPEYVDTRADALG